MCQRSFEKECFSLNEIANKMYNETNTVIEYYMIVRFIVPTSNTCERPFLKTRQALTDTQKSIFPICFGRRSF